MAKVARTFTDLDAQLDRQISFFNASCNMYDQGWIDEAARLATIVRILLRDSPAGRGNSRSLLSQLGIKEKLRFLDTGIYRDEWEAVIRTQLRALGQQEADTFFEPGPGQLGLLVQGTEPNGNPGWVAPLDRPRFHPSDPAAAAVIKDRQEFEVWWNRPLVPGKSKTFSRCELVGIMCDQDGGAHVDPKIDEDYLDLTWSNQGLWVADGDHMDDPDLSAFTPVASNIAAASVRQIAYEMGESLNEYFKSLEPNKE